MQLSTQKEKKNRFSGIYVLHKREKRPLDSRTRTTTSTRFHLKFFRVLSKNIHLGILHCFFFSPDKLQLLSLLGSLSSDVFERRTSTGSEVFSLLTCLDDIKFVFLSFFTVIEAI